MPTRDPLAYGILIHTKDGEIVKVDNPAVEGSMLQISADLVRSWERTERTRSFRDLPGPMSLRDRVLYIRLASGWTLRWRQLGETPPWPSIWPWPEKIYQPQVVYFRRMSSLAPPGWRPDAWLWMQDYAARIFAPPLFDTESNLVVK